MAKQRKPYDNLSIMPSIVASTVVETTYTGEEISIQLRSGDFVVKTEYLRQSMSHDLKNQFIAYVDNRCRQAYEEEVEWFEKIVTAKGNKGRDQLYMWVSHWLAGFLRQNAEAILTNAFSPKA